MFMIGDKARAERQQLRDEVKATAQALGGAATWGIVAFVVVAVVAVTALALASHAVRKVNE